MRSPGRLLAGLLGAVLTAAALVSASASASMLGVDGGSLHHWVEHGPDLGKSPPAPEDEDVTDFAAPADARSPEAPAGH